MMTSFAAFVFLSNFNHRSEALALHGVLLEVQCAQ